MHTCPFAIQSIVKGYALYCFSLVSFFHYYIVKYPYSSHICTFWKPQDKALLSMVPCSHMYSTKFANTCIHVRMADPVWIQTTSRSGLAQCAFNPDRFNAHSTLQVSNCIKYNV